MIKAKINGTELKISEREPLLAGSVGLSRIKFEFSAEWANLTRQIDFTNEQSGDTRRISAQGSECTVPWELLRCEGDISCYVRGIGADGTLRLRTNDANLGTVLGSVSESAPGSGTPTPDVCDEVAAKLGDLNDLETEAKDNLVAAVNEAARSGGGAEVFELTVAILSPTNIQSDKTFAEIKAAAVAGRPFRMTDVNDIVYEPQVAYSETLLELTWFWETAGTWCRASAVVNSEDVWTLDVEPFSDPVTEQTVSGWGFTKNSGTYSKPAGGIPKSDLASGVQASLDKADSALQSVPSTYRTATAQDAIDNTKVTKVTGKGLSANDYTDAAKAKVDAIPASPKYTDTVYDDTALKSRLSAVESKLSGGSSGGSGFSGSYNDLTDKPTIPTEQTVSGWGFTKNSGTYSKPTGGIPKSDLASGVQASLGKADTALQAHQSLAAYRTADEQDVIDAGKVNKAVGKTLTSNDYTDAAKAKVDAIPASPKYTDTVYDDTAVKNRVSAVEGKLGGSGAVSFASVTADSLTTKGEVEIYGDQPHLDFHFGNSSGDYTTRIIETASGKLNLSAPSGVEINGKKADTESVTLSVVSSRLTNLSYTAKYSELMGAVFVRIYGVVNAEMTSGTQYPILSVGSHKSGYVTALTVNCNVGCRASTRNDDNGNGVIALQPTASGINGKAVYITGFWFV